MGKAIQERKGNGEEGGGQQGEEGATSGGGLTGKREVRPKTRSLKER